MTSQTWSQSNAHPSALDGAEGGGPVRAGSGTVIGERYLLRAPVGHGGMGTVWRATDTLLRREVAVKEVVPPSGMQPSDLEAMYQRTMREARAAAALSHPAVVQVYDVVTEGGRPWIIMELLDARSLSEIVISDGPLSPRAVAKVGVALLGALEVAHAAGVLHRDVKPANVLICVDGRCVLTDFGVARMPSDQELTTPGMVLGSPHFISPERAMGGSFGPPSDLFSLGVTLYAAVEGCLPFDKGDPIATMHAVVEEEPLPPVRAGALAAVLDGLLEKDPSRRWSAAMARQVLRDLLTGPLARSAREPARGAEPGPAAAPPEAWRADAWQPAGTWQPPGHAEGGFGDPTTASVAGYAGPAAPGPAPPGQAARAGFGTPAGYGSAGTPGGSYQEADSYQAAADAYGQVPDPYRTALDGYSDPLGVPPVPLGDADRPGEVTGTPVPRQPAGWPAPAAAPGLGGAHSARPAGTGLAAKFRRLPRSMKVAAAAGVTAAVLIGLIAALGGRFGGGDPGGVDAGGPQPTGGPPEAGTGGGGPLIEVQEFADRGVVVNLPAQWRQAGSTELYVDFVDPADASAKVRLLREPSRAGPMRFIEIAEPNIARNCPEPYARVGLTEAEVGGRPAGLLEYTCGEGAEARHSRWATVVHEQTAYSFYLSVAERQYAERAVIFDELVRSFQLAG